MPRARLLFVMGLVVLGVAAASAYALNRPAARGSRSHASQARAEARRLLAVAPRPPGSRPLLTPPSGLANSPGGPVVPNPVDLVAFYSAPGTPAGVIAWVAAHPPRGTRRGDSGSDGRLSQWQSFDVPGVPGVLRPADVEEEAVPYGPHRVALRIDAQTSPLPVLPGNGHGPGSLRVVADGFGGVYGFTLRCGPSGGTVPHPSHVCASIRRDPTLLYSFPGPDHSCPGNAGVMLDGTWDGKPLHSVFSECTGGQELSAGQWLSLLPSADAETAVHVDRGIGLVRLGETEAHAVDLLRGSAPAGRSCDSCIRTFAAGGNVGYGTGPSEPLGWTLGFTHGAVTSISSDIPTRIGTAALTFGFARVAHHLGWQLTSCGTDHEVVHSSSHGSTIVYYAANGDYRSVLVAAAPPVCAAA